MRTTALVVLSCIATAAPGARAQPAPPSAAASPAAPAPPAVEASPTAPTYPPAPYPAYPYAPYSAYPPAPHPAPPYYPAAPDGIDPQAIYVYDMQRRSPGLALLLEFLIPGVGSIYGGHPAGAAATWGMSLAGFALVFGGIDQSGDGRHSNDARVTAIYLGVGLIIGGRIYGLVDSFSSTCDYNRTLAQQLGLPAGLALAPAPIRVGDRVAWGPALSLRF